jgi:hypothetical protein
MVPIAMVFLVQLATTMVFPKASTQEPILVEQVVVPTQAPTEYSTEFPTEFPTEYSTMVLEQAKVVVLELVPIEATMEQVLLVATPRISLFFL